MISAGQGKPRVLDTDRAGLDDGGYLMVVLLIGIAVSAVWMGALLPSWRQQAVREREAELIFRGEQYARAIALYYRKNQRLPPNIDTLVSQRYIRRKYLDPMTGEEFLPLGALTPGTSGAAQPQGPQGRGGAAPGGGRAGGGAGGPQAGGGFTGISGVRSTSNDTSIVVYQNQQSYSQFPFDYQLAMQKMGVVQGPANGGRQGAGGARGRGPGDELQPVGPRGGRGPARGPGAGGPNRGGAGAGPAPARPGAGQAGGTQSGRR